LSLLVVVAGRQALAAPKAVEISNTTAKVTNDPIEEGQMMMEVRFDATFNKKPGDKYFHVKGKCQVGTKSFVDTTVAMEPLKDLDKGDSKSVEAYPFANNGLKAAPSKCEFTIFLGDALNTGVKIHSFNWAP
jgi:hypothetical protein